MNFVQLGSIRSKTVVNIKMIKMKNFLVHPLDDVADRISHFLTALLLISSAVICYHRSDPSQMLECRTPSGMASVFLPPIQYVQTACSARRLFSEDEYTTKPSEITLDTDESGYILEWPFYIPYLLGFSSLLALLPNYIQICFLRNTDRDLIRPLNSTDQHRIVSIFANRIFKRKFGPSKCKEYSCSFISLFSHCFLKLFSIATLYCILCIVQTLLPWSGRFNYFQAVWILFKATVSGESSGYKSGGQVFRRLFPTDFICPFPSHHPGLPYIHFHCIFLSNSMYGCICFILITWLILAIFVQTLTTLNWILILFVPKFKKAFLENSLETVENLPGSIRDDRFINKITTADTMLMMYQLEMLMGTETVGEIVKYMHNEFERERQTELPTTPAEATTV